jgi:FMN phosphatase YigB (HAD superfamily)
VPAALDQLAAADSSVAVLTNGDPHQQRLKLQRTGLLDHFDRVLTPRITSLSALAASLL